MTKPISNSVISSNWVIKILIIFVAIITQLLNYSITGLSSAQTSPEFLITWKAASYVPSDYQGKILPASETPVEFALELIDNGKVADLSQNEIRWFINNNLQASGAGLKTFRYVPDLPGRGDKSVKAQIMNYRGRDLEAIKIVPAADPEAVIDAPYLNREIKADINVFRALPYFFNIKSPAQLSFQWSANGRSPQEQTDKPHILNLDAGGLPSGQQFNLSVVISNLLKPIEIGSQSIILRIK